MDSGNIWGSSNGTFSEKAQLHLPHSQLFLNTRPPAAWGVLWMGSRGQQRAQSRPGPASETCQCPFSSLGFPRLATKDTAIFSPGGHKNGRYGMCEMAQGRNLTNHAYWRRCGLRPAVGVGIPAPHSFLCLSFPFCRRGTRIELTPWGHSEED